MISITEEEEVYFEEYSDLEYFKKRKEMITLYNKGKIEGNCYIWKDSEMDNREYIILNYEVIYLDTLNVFKK
jgi:hypothetical protein